MAIDLAKKRILMIHGLGGKPPAADLHALWSKCLIENVRCDDSPLAAALEAQPGVMRHAYWADAVPHHVPDDRAYVKQLEKRVDAVIDERRTAGDDFHVPKSLERVGAFFQDRGADLVKLIGGALTIKDDVMRSFFRETELYEGDQYVADRIRLPLEAELRDAWEQGMDVALLSHSMGTFVSYDVLWRFSHRSEPEFRRYRDERVRMFVTMGSPLCDSAVRDLLFARHHESPPRRRFPTNLDYWHNYACLGDVVAHGADFEEVFFRPMRSARLLPETPKTRSIDYGKLHNPFVVVSHRGNRDSEKRNPHKSFGYLVQPRLGTWIADFLRERLK